MFRKCFAELIGTAMLIIIGCGSAMLLLDPAYGSLPHLIVALAFGLAIVLISYGIGNISGGHVNPAISMAAYIDERISLKELIAYVASQIIGAILGTAILATIFIYGGIADYTQSFAANTAPATNGIAPETAACITEIMLTYMFALCVLGASDAKKNNKNAGIVIGLALTAVHIFGISITGTSVNPARSIAPAIFAAVGHNSVPMQDLWIFITAPIIGGILAGITYRTLNKPTSIVENIDEYEYDNDDDTDDEDESKKQEIENTETIDPAINNTTTVQENPNIKIEQEIRTGSAEAHQIEDKNITITAEN